VESVDTRAGLTPEPPRESGFVIDGETYSIPTLDTITLNEERVLYIYADTVLQVFAPAHADATKEEQEAVEQLQWRKIRNPDFKRALAHIAYRRKHPEVTDAEVQAAIGGANALEVDLAILRGVDDSPPAPSSQKPPESRSDTRPLSRPTDSGSPTESSSDPADGSPESIGTTESGTSSPGVVPIASGR
jgi:hypothetical protein